MTNRLASERSPYLALHGNDPVDWYPWGPEAHERARQERRPVFLSVGYASCHWCHVMQRESFKDPAIAEVLNERFVSIKVDRESRPDIDEVYMAYVVAANGHGGWPMSVFLTPDLVPIMGGTYFPPVRTFGMPSFSEVLEQVAVTFEHAPGDVEKAAGQAAEYLRAMFAPMPPSPVTQDVVDKAARTLIASADPRHGGFGKAPKFPQAPVTDFLLAYHEALDAPRALAAAEFAVERMIRGGIYDQAGGGIARYATDDEWLVPHFEKMLYDNGMLLSTLAALHLLAPRDEWAHAMRETAAFLERDLRVEGGYASSLSADTLGEEGATYVWSHADLAEHLSHEELGLAETHLGITPGGNWEGTSILTRSSGRDADAEKVDALLIKLLRMRGDRPQPDVDDKVIVSWNALAARGLISAGDAIGDAALTARGIALVRSLIDSAVSPEGDVARIVGSEEPGVLEDAVGLAAAALAAWRATEDAEMMSNAKRLFDRAVAHFHEGDGVWYMTPAATDLPIRPREQHDSPLPSGPSLAAGVALALGVGTGDADYIELASATLARQTGLADRSPFAAGTALEAMVRLVTVEDAVQV